MIVIPTILEKNFNLAEAKIRFIKDLSRWIQIDVIDGSLSEGKSFELELLNKMENEILNNLIDIHLMVKEPIKWIEKCNFVGASRIIGQVEMMNNRQVFVDEVKAMGLEAGLAFDINTEIDNLPKEIDLVLVMGRKMGFETAVFENIIYEKINKLMEFKKQNQVDFKIGVDGGVNEEIIKKLKVVGVDIAYCGGAIFNGNVSNNWEKLSSLSN